MPGYRECGCYDYGDIPFLHTIDCILKRDSQSSLISREARCQDCGEIFNPVSNEDLEHVERLDGEPCGGQGILSGGWS